MHGIRRCVRRDLVEAASSYLLRYLLGGNNTHPNTFTELHAAAGGQNFKSQYEKHAITTTAPFTTCRADPSLGWHHLLHPLLQYLTVQRLLSRIHHTLRNVVIVDWNRKKSRSLRQEMHKTGRSCWSPSIPVLGMGWVRRKIIKFIERTRRTRSGASGTRPIVHVLIIVAYAQRRTRPNAVLGVQ